MSVLLKVYEYIEKIKNGEISFQQLINKGLKEINEADSYLIKDSIKSIVNRYYFLMWEQNKIIKIEDEKIKDYFICALGQYHYVKEIDDEKLLGFFNEDKEELEGINPEEMIKAITNLGGSQYPISQKENEIIVKRLAINYAYPEWVIKMMTKQFGIKHTYKAVASSRKSIKIALNCNTFLCDSEKILANASENTFEKGKLATNALRYIGKEKLIDLPEFKKNQVFVEDEVSQLLVEKLGLETGDEALLVCEDRGTIALNMAMMMKDVGTIHVACQNIFDLNSTRNIANRFKIHSLDMFESTVDLLLTHVPNDSCDKILLIPNSTQFGLIRRKPAVLLTLKRDSLDELIANQKKELEEVSNFLKSGGKIVYAVYTYNRKESNLVISDFLEKHQDFSLIEEKQLFSYEAPSDGVYYAIIQKK